MEEFLPSFPCSLQVMSKTHPVRWANKVTKFGNIVTLLDYFLNKN